MTSTIDTSTIDQLLQDAVRTGAVPGVAAMAANRDGPIYEGAAGPRAVGGSDPLTPDTHFRIMSMTKMLCTVSALQQMEKGTLDIDAPIEAYCPDFAAVAVLDGWDGDTPRLRSPATKATVKQLITHTTGLAYWIFDEDLVRWEASTGTPNVLSGANVIFNAPMTADPGTCWRYGINTDWLGKVVEATSGTTLDVAIKDGITGPLGMGETSFLMTGDQQATATPIHVQSEDGSWVATDVDLRQDPEYWAGGHGLYSTPRDYLRFQQALLHDGTLGGATILRKATVDAAFRNQIGDLDFPASMPTADPTSSCDFNAGPGFKWGYGLLLNQEDVPGGRRAWSGAWAGLANTHFWVDRSAGVTGAIYSQFLPFAPAEALALYGAFEQAVYASI